MDIARIDENISIIARELDFYSRLTPGNKSSEEKTFFEMLKEGKKYDPVFEYPETRTASYRKRLDELKIGLDEDGGIGTLLSRKIDFMMCQLDMLDADDRDLGDISIRMFGTPEKNVVDKAYEILKEPSENVFTRETVSPEEMSDILTVELEKNGLDWHCLLSPKLVPKITVSGKDRTVYINSHIPYTPEEIDRLKVHEIKVHVYRGANGDRQSYTVFREGLAGYNETEEGLAMIMEKVSGCLKKDRRQEKLYAGRAVCSHLCLNSSFYDSFIGMREYFPEYIAYRLVERCKRGMCHTSVSGGLTKGAHYISGWIKVSEYIEDEGDMGILYVGKIGIEDIPIVKSMIDKGQIIKPAYVPDYPLGGCRG